MTIGSVQVAKSLVEGGKVKAVGVTSRVRSPALPNVPTLVEAGMKSAAVDLRFWFAVFGPKGMPEPVKAKIEKAVQTVTADTQVRERLAKLDITPEFTPSAELRVKLDNEIRNWTKFIDGKGIKPE